jgi:hypothetical protein
MLRRQRAAACRDLQRRRRGCWLADRGTRHPECVQGDLWWAARAMGRLWLLDQVPCVSTPGRGPGGALQ